MQNSRKSTRLATSYKKNLLKIILDKRNKLLLLLSKVILVNNQVLLQEIHDEEYHFQLE
jgi:hypothetical protein